MTAMIHPSDDPLFEGLRALERTLRRAAARGDPVSNLARRVAEIISAAFIAKADFQHLRDEIAWGEYNALTLTQVEEWRSLHSKLLREGERCCGFPHVEAMMKDLSAQIDSNPNIDARFRRRLLRHINHIGKLLKYAHSDAQSTLARIYWEEWVIANHKGISLQSSAPSLEN